MEVHHHPDLHHKRKKFKEYFLEFLMIFLAVTMGFFAENIREEINDAKKAHQFAKGLIRDIQHDINDCDSNIAFLKEKVSIYDTLLSLLNSDSASLNKMYDQFFRTMDYTGYTGRTITIDQLKSTGQMRLFSEDKSADSINLYYEASMDLRDYTNTYMKSFFYYHEEGWQLFQYSEAKKRVHRSFLDPSIKLKLLNNNYELKQKVYNKLFVLRVVSHDFIWKSEDLKSQAISCIKYLKEKYSIEN